MRDRKSVGVDRARIESRTLEYQRQERLRARQPERGLPHPETVTAPPVRWAAVESARGEYVPWPRDRWAVDSAADFEENLGGLLRLLASAADPDRG